jgi:RNA polymerase sigma factor (sigma-70 family)
MIFQMTGEQDATNEPQFQWLEGLRKGDQVSTERLWHLYFEKMVLLARRKLRGVSTSARSEEDIALSAFKSFCLGLRQGRFSPEHGTVNLWPLLVTLTINKAIDQLRYQNRQKRGGRSVNDKKSLTLSIPSMDDLLSTEPTAESIAVASESMDLLFDQLDQTGDLELKAIALASIEGETPAEMAKRLDCSIRTVQRKLKTIRTIWESRGL